MSFGPGGPGLRIDSQEMPHSSGNSVQDAARDRDPSSRAAGSAFDNTGLWLACVTLVFALQALLIVRHIPWLDEWQALLIVEQTPSLTALFETLRYEGHPPLWYALLAVLARIVPFAMVLPAAGLIVAAMTQAMIQFVAPFSRAERLMLGVGEIALFEFGTISRGLALGALVMIAVAALWRSRWVWLALALLPLSEFLFGVVAVILIGLRWRERRLWAPGLALVLAAAAFAAWAVHPAGDVVPAEKSMGVLSEVTDFVQRLGSLIVPFQTYDGAIAWDGYLPFGLGGLSGGVFLLWMWQRYAAQPAHKAAIFALIALCFAMSVAIYPLHFRHLTVVAWLVVVLTWLRAPDAEREGKRWRGWLALGAVCGIVTAGVALARPFDASPRVVAAMQRLSDGRHPWLVFPATRVPPLAALIHRGFRVPSRGCDATFVRWNETHDTIKPRVLRAALPQWAERYGESFLILEKVPRGVPLSVFRPLTGTMQGYNGQRYVIGLLGSGRPVKPLPANPCVAGLTALK